MGWDSFATACIERVNPKSPAGWLNVTAPLILTAAIARFGPNSLQPSFVVPVAQVPAREWLVLGFDLVLAVAIWSCFLIALDFVAEAMKRAMVMEEAFAGSREDSTAQAVLPANPYDALDDSERVCMALFINEGSAEIPAVAFASLFGEDNWPTARSALRRLEQRNFVQSRRLESGVRYHLADRHFRLLSEQPHLIGSELPPKYFG